MKFYSPLRYPGGKSKLSNFVSKICITNDVSGCYVEPYAGGASVALYLLLENLVSKIVINDKDRSIYSFWHSVLNESDELVSLIFKTEVSIENWRKCKEIQKNKDNASLLDLGFSTFFLNRTNISGILDAGVIGGLKQKGKYKIDCRYNKEELIRRIRNIARKRRSVELYNMDALDLIDLVQDKFVDDQSTIVYFDPPYYIKGPSLYMNYYKKSDHELVAERIKKIGNVHWIVSYDNVQEIKKMYTGQRKIEYSLTYTAKTYKVGKEVLFFSDALKIPSSTLLSKS